MSTALYLVYETASGYSLFERIESDEIGMQLSDVQSSVTDFSRFSRIIKLKAFVPFTSAAEALENINHVSEGLLHETLSNFLSLNCPKSKKSFKVGFVDVKLAASVHEGLGYQCSTEDIVIELLRGIRLHFESFLKDLKKGDLTKAQLGLGHAYSRGKVKFNVNRIDNMIIQAISLLDQLDKDINTFAMRVREWYGWHFPELVKIVSDNYLYARCVATIQHKNQLTEENLPSLSKILGGDDEKAKQVLDAARSSMGMEISDVDMQNVEIFANRVVSLADYRKELHNYLLSKMDSVAPNLSSLIGEMVGARLIAHAGSLVSLAKYPASTVQILGAEKALFRALKTKGKTPKYGLIFHSSFIGRAGAKNKGRISRYLANKCSMASRIDSFSDEPTHVFGEQLKSQVEERLAFYEGKNRKPRKNIDVMSAANEVVQKQAKESSMEVEGATTNGTSSEKKKKKKKRKSDAIAMEVEEDEQPSKKKKKTSKSTNADADEETPKKKKKKKRKSEA